MKAATVKEIKYELSTRSHSELLDLCMRLSRFKKENKELLTYLLYEVSDEKAYIESVKSEISHAFEEINISSYFYIRKSIRKILRMIKKYIRYSKKKETEVELLIYFCSELKKLGPFGRKNVTLVNLYKRQIALIEKTVSSMHEDLQYDYNLELNTLK